jgi:DNA-directed RNA polymerase subunit F
VSVEHLEGTADLEDEELTYMYRVTFEYLKSRAHDPEKSRSLISATAAELWA